MTAKLYSLATSHPAQAARVMLELKRIDHEVVDLLPGTHPLLLRARGFRGGTVPALRLDGARVQGSLRISRFLDQAEPRSPLFPEEPERRGAVEDAEAWGEAELQPVPRRLFRWGTVHQPELRRWLADIFDAEFAHFMDANFDSPLDLVGSPASARDLLRLVRLGGFGRLGAQVDRKVTDPRLRRIFTFQALYAASTSLSRSAPSTVCAARQSVPTRTTKDLRIRASLMHSACSAE